MKTAAEIIDAVAAAHRLPTPVPAHAALGPAFVAECIAIAVAEVRAEEKQRPRERQKQLKD